MKCSPASAPTAAFTASGGAPSAPVIHFEPMPAAARESMKFWTAAAQAAWSSSPFFVLKLPSGARSDATSVTTSQPGTFSNAACFAALRADSLARASGPAR
eukprot:CAMPEP_0196675636 /NCGR_PEP_ID=MMETSP1090-20130531/4218_1 /TAXON_ID=37098 /ORGANISM="Isochrysis sp, Strain CCMP1244" /LENGTH=100 /DNA_ID=CAMNT_0042013497 /DNA_START=348 /DNA_END=650 /DNA_ORIENTATION=-